jgi:hypothetical protein
MMATTMTTTTMMTTMTMTMTFMTLCIRHDDITGVFLFLFFRVEFNEFFVAEHTGTHLDAPAHFGKDHWRTHQIPPSRLVAPAIVVDVTAKVSADHDYVISVQDLQVSTCID